MTTLPRFLWQYLHPWRRSVLTLALVILMSTVLQLAAPLLTARFIDDALAGQPLRDLLTLAAIVLGLTLCAQVLGIPETRIAESLGWSVTNQIRADLTAHLLRLDYRFHTAHTQGELIERVDGDTGNLARLFSRFAINVVGNGLLVLGLLAVLLSIDVRIAAGVGVIAGLALTLMLTIRKRATPRWAEERHASAGVYGFLSEYLDGLEAVQAGGAGTHQFVVHGFLARMRGWLRSSTRAGMWGYSLAATSTGMFMLALAYALAMGGYLHRSEGLTIGSLFLAVRLVDMLREPVQRLRDEIQDLQQAAASLARVRSLLDERPRILDGTGARLPEGALPIEWRNVSFAYATGQPVLRDVSLTAQAGRVLGIVGRTGSGKSTLARFVPRQLDPDSGKVFLGGVDLRELRLSDVRARIGVVGQDVQLFDATLRENIAMFALSEKVDDIAIIDTIEKVGLGDWLMNLPAGLDTRIGRGGIGLSAGQEQLVSCTRVLLRNPDVVVLDEASARLDPVSERRLHFAMSRLVEGRTAVIIAHRLDTLALTDDIAVISAGQLVEFGRRIDLAGDPNSHLASLLRTDTAEAVQ